MLPVVGHFKQLCNWSQEQERVPVAVCVLPLGPDCDSPYYRLATASKFCCTMPTILFAAGCLIYIHSPLARLCCAADLWGQGKARRFAGQVQRWAFVAFQLAIGWYSSTEIQRRLWWEVCECFPLMALTALTSLIEWLVSLSNRTAWCQDCATIRKLGMPNFWTIFGVAFVLGSACCLRTWELFDMHIMRKMYRPFVQAVQSSILSSEHW